MSILTWLEKHWNRHEPDPHPAYHYDDTAVPEYHTGKVKHPQEDSCEEESIHYDNVAIPEVHLPRKKK